jgi:hypothetical protein
MGTVPQIERAIEDIPTAQRAPTRAAQRPGGLLVRAAASAQLALR